MTYELRDRTGCLVGEPDTAAVGIGAARRPRVEGLDLGWTTDPLTGMPVPAFLLSG